MTPRARLARPLALAALVLGLAAPAAVAQIALQKAVALAPATIYINPDAASAHVGELAPGAEVGIQTVSNGWAQVFSGVSGWIPNHGLVRYDDPNAAEVIFGAAVQFENQAESAGGEDQAAQTASRLYLDIYNDFPAAPQAAEALYRGANILWQIKISEEPPRRDPSERLFPDDSQMRRVIARFPKTPWAARAEYSLLIEHFTCGDWYAKPQCVEKEAHTYADYAKKYPDGPMTPEADYDALYREAIAWTLYRSAGPHPDPAKAAENKRAVLAGAAQMQQAFPRNDWTAQAVLLAFNLGQDTPLKVPATPPMGGP